MDRGLDELHLHFYMPSIACSFDVFSSERMSLAFLRDCDMREMYVCITTVCMVYEGMCKIRFDEMRMDMNDRRRFDKSLHLRYSGHSLPGL
jgi:hypothetical protein